MGIKNLSILKGAAALAAAAVVVSCSAYQPYDYHDERETMQGPGLFSGPDGVFRIYGPQDPQAPQGDEDPDERGGDVDGKATETDR
jgi:hypothetical protein